MKRKVIRRIIKNKTNIHFSSKSNEWETPDWFFKQLDLKYGPFTLDPCCTHETAKCKDYFTEEENGLQQKWEGKVFMNPPYGRTIGQWIKKAFESAQEGALVVCLIPSRTDTKYWHEYVMKANEILFVKGRLKFGGHKNPAPFPNAVVVFQPGVSAVRLEVIGYDISGK